MKSPVEQTLPCLRVPGQAGVTVAIQISLARFFGMSLLLLWGSAVSAQPTRPQVDVFHWWVSGGERASLDVIRDTAQSKGLGWTESSTAGSGTDRYTKVLDQRVRSGKTPTAAQMIGHDIHAWAARGLLANLDDIARREEWDAVVPMEIQHLSKYGGHWVAAPFNTHSTNWLWVNQPLATSLGVTTPPDTFSDLVVLLEKARRAGVVPLAIGREQWEHTLLFELVAAGALGASTYRKAFVELIPETLTQEQATLVFARIRTLSRYVDPGSQRRSWDEASEMVRTGKALMQAQGTWVNGEFTARGMVPGREYACWRFPDTQGMFLFNADQYIFFREPTAGKNGVEALASLLMSPDLQEQVNVRSGAAPARVDMSPEPFNACGKRAIAGLRASNMRRTVLGSIAMGNANPAAVKTAIYQVVTKHLRGALSDESAAVALRKALYETPAASAKRGIP